MKKVGLLQIFLSFAKVGALTFGGGYAMLPLLQKEAVERHNWLTDNDISDYYALAQCSPGLIAVNMAVYIAYPLRGLAGVVAAALGVIAPSVLIILLLATLLQTLSHIELITHAFAAIRAAVAVLVIQAVYRLYKNGIVDTPTQIIFILTLIAGVLNIISPVLMILIAAFSGIIIQIIKKRKAGDGQ
ncbi:MAG: chromate transporter [Firmicutes bacterium]|nr:chromate transporter [Bacillota bacterium]